MVHEIVCIFVWGHLSLWKDVIKQHYMSFLACLIRILLRLKGWVIPRSLANRRLFRLSPFLWCHIFYDVMITIFLDCGSAAERFAPCQIESCTVKDFERWRLVLHFFWPEKNYKHVLILGNWCNSHNSASNDLLSKLFSLTLKRKPQCKCHLKIILHC